ncbi:MBL fold metallo-hydrolase [Limnobacter humi]|uniref:MBL fold metallo-hydrolase n=1 Tax=Limnobacter humi TaxID=1778671 RepID=A0ABT1WGG8_9BURK|nr:MBL fold metallo-hydrolase [Limnobacter humi]MCQ8896121.1 MBL fold metallo-hydrolase [Limnobacter humi]
MKLGLKTVAVLYSATLLSACASSNPYYDASKPHHRPDGFVNSDGTRIAKSMDDVLRWYRERFGKTLPPPPGQYRSSYADFKVHPFSKTDWESAGRLSATWLGHATVLLKINDFTVLTDPHFSPRAFPIQWAGPAKRKIESPITVEQLPPIRVVVISHNHYDHLDKNTIVQLARLQPDTVFMVPLGVERTLADWGIENTVALDWWDSAEVDGVPITLVPAHHWSTRTWSDRNETLWGGWVVQHPALRFYFSGDTGYSKDFAEIGKRLGPFDFSAIAVGAYEPRWFMKEQHINPEEAVKVHREVKSSRSLGVHWGTFELTDEALDQPLGDVDQAARRAGLKEGEFVMLEHGQTLRLDKP